MIFLTTFHTFVYLTLLTFTPLLPAPYPLPCSTFHLPVHLSNVIYLCVHVCAGPHACACVCMCVLARTPVHVCRGQASSSVIFHLGF